MPALRRAGGATAATAVSVVFEMDGSVLAAAHAVILVDTGAEVV
jgi:hypothetical protein